MKVTRTGRQNWVAPSRVVSPHEAQGRWSHWTTPEALVHGHHGIAELLQIIPHLRSDSFVAEHQ